MSRVSCYIHWLATPRLPPSEQPFFYDFIGQRLRVDSFALIGLGELNSSSYWLGDSLYIYDFGIAKSCQLLNMTFGEVQARFITHDAHNT